MKKALLSITLVIVALALLAGIYFMIPGIYHPFFYFDSAGKLAVLNATQFPRIVRSSHHRYSLVLFALAALFAVVAFFLREKRTQRA